MVPQPRPLLCVPKAVVQLQCWVLLVLLGTLAATISAQVLKVAVAQTVNQVVALEVVQAVTQQAAEVSTKEANRVTSLTITAVVVSVVAVLPTVAA